MLPPPPPQAPCLRPAGKTRTQMNDTERKNSRDPDGLTNTERAWRDKFVLEYLKDFNATQAMFRCGHTNPNSARTQGSLMLREPYIARALDDYLRKMEAESVVTRGQVMAALWKEANAPKNFEGVRVNALAKIATMLGMDRAPKAAEGEKTTALMGVMLVPLVAPEDWQASAMRTQQELKTKAGTEVTRQTHANN